MSNDTINKLSPLDVAVEVVNTEISALQLMVKNLDDNFSKAVDVIFNTTGRVILCGMGKSGIIGKKISASLASTGTPSFFMHPGEAFHGDLGMVRSEDVFIGISNSGETDEVLKLLPFLRANGNFLISMTRDRNSTLAKNSHCQLSIAITKEACPLQLAPTSSTTASLVMGDALTVALMRQREFSPENFARFHPGGNLGRRLLGKVKDEMVSCDLPFVSQNEKLSQVISVISSGRLGLAVVKGNRLNKLGVITDGDLRRAIEAHGKDVFDLCAEDICSFNPFVISPEVSIEKAYALMDQEKINALIVSSEGLVIGVFKR